MLYHESLVLYLHLDNEDNRNSSKLEVDRVKQFAKVKTLVDNREFIYFLLDAKGVYNPWKLKLLL